MSRQTKFNVDWLKDHRYSAWVGKDPDCETKARCVLCGVKFELGNMGVRALASHADGKKHQKKVKMMQSGDSSITSFFVKRETKDDEQATFENSEAQFNLQDMTIPPPPPLPSTSNESVTENTKENSTLTKYVVNDMVLKAEVLWALKTVVNHFSCNSSANNDVLFQAMFPDSQIARQFKCGPSKCSYLIKFGLSEYYRGEMLNLVKGRNGVFVVSFDESLNKTIQEEQMDLLVRFWDSELNKVVTRYFTSVFLGHTTADDLMRCFKQGLSELNTSRMLQVSMDGPTTNWKFYDKLLEGRRQVDPNIPDLLNIGSCGLHVVHGAFRYGAGKSGWNLDCLLRSLYWIFVDSPARREDFSNVKSGTVEGKIMFPLKFCGTRWLEDMSVAERAILIWPDVCNYLSDVQKLPKSKQPTCQSYRNLLDFKQDPLVVAKLHFFISIAKMLTEFLKVFQTEKPMVPFLSQELESVIRSLLSRFVKPTVISSVTSASGLAKVDVSNKDNLVAPDKVDIGFASKKVVDDAKKSSSVSQLQRYEFYQECITFMSKTVEKLNERSPLKYSLVRALQSLDPRFVALHTEKATEKFQVLLRKLLDCKWLTSDMCDNILQQFKRWILDMDNTTKEIFKSYSMKNERLDKFYITYFSNREEYKDLFEMVKMMLILSHGQSAVERGFSINKDMLTPNLAKESLVSYRTVYDGAKREIDRKNSEAAAETKTEAKKLDVSKVTVTKKMLSDCRAARSRYQQYLDDAKKLEALEKENERKTEIEKELSNLRKNKRKLESSIVTMQKDADDIALEAEKKRKIELLSKSNAFRAKATDMKKDLTVLDAKISSLQEKLNTS